MFTGLIQTLAKVASITPDGHGGSRLTLLAPGYGTVGVLGESIAVNGCCLTLVAFDANQLQFDCGPETLARTNLGRLAVDSPVNLERALKVGDPLGGHFVSGHIDGVGRVKQIVPNGEWRNFHFSIPPEFDELLVVKGSIAIDGVSLTLVTVEPGEVSVMLIPHTLAATTLGSKNVGDEVNLEIDMIAKHVKKLFGNLSITV
ncbi:MAG: riboflavin synthase [Fimbriiglobus sp.]